MTNLPPISVTPTTVSQEPMLGEVPADPVREPGIEEPPRGDPEPREPPREDPPVNPPQPGEPDPNIIRDPIPEHVPSGPMKDPPLDPIQT